MVSFLPPQTAARLRSAYLVATPADAARELAHNCLDAGAASVAVRFSPATLDLRVADNGRGIPSPDLLLLGQRHHSSKTLADPAFGFRGEALASISCIADVEVDSKCASEHAAYKIIIKDELITQHGRGGVRENGTTVTVRNVLARFPVRRRALLRGEAGIDALRRVLEILALAHHDKAFTLHDMDTGRCVLSFRRASSAQRAMRQLYSDQITRGLVDIVEHRGQFSVRGCISTIAHPSKTHQHIYINRFHIENEELYARVNRVFSESRFARDQDARG